MSVPPRPDGRGDAHTDTGTAPHGDPGAADARGAAVAVLISACAFGSLAVGVTLANRAGVALQGLMAWRYLLATPLLMLVAGGPTALRIPGRDIRRLLILGGLGQVAVTSLSFSALRWIDAGQLGFLFYTYPAWVAVLMATHGVEPLTRGRLAALGLALVGITTMVGVPWRSSLPLPGLLLALSSAVVYAAYIPVLHRARGPHPAAVASTYVIGGAAIVFVTWALATGTLVRGMTPAIWGVAVGAAVIGTVAAFLLFLRGLAVLGAVRAAILSTVEPFWTALLAALVLGQPIGPRTILGGTLIMAAILLLQRSAHPVVEADAPPPE